MAKTAGDWSRLLENLWAREQVSGKQCLDGDHVLDPALSAAPTTSPLQCTKSFSNTVHSKDGDQTKG